MKNETITFVKNSQLKYNKTSQEYERYKKRDIFKEIKGNFAVLYGIRGSGKTTLLFQKYLTFEKNKRIYLNAEEIILTGFDLNEIIEAVEYLFGDNTAVFIDEINAIKEWDKKLKISYDTYPKMNFFVTGSSSINIKEAKAVARRAEYFHIIPLSFREYLYLKYNIKIKQFRIEQNDLRKSAIHYEIYLKQMIENEKFKVLELVEEYIENNLVYLLEKNKTTLTDLVEKAILDIGKMKNLETFTLSKFERMILILSSSSETNYENLSKDLDISKSMVGEMLSSLEKTGLIKKVYPFKKGKTIARKNWKYFFTVPSIRKIYAQKLLVDNTKINGYMMEDIFASNFEDIYFGEIDFIWKNYLIEIGSRKKGYKQFKKINTKMNKIIIYNGLEVEGKEDIIKIPFYIWYSQI